MCCDVLLILKVLLCLIYFFLFIDHYLFLNILGPFMMRSTCRYCQGTRMFIKHKCMECEGTGNTVQSRKVTVPVPAGLFVKPIFM